MDEKIEVRYKELADGIYHKYIIYTDYKGDMFYGRGGPTFAFSQESGFALSATNLTLIDTMHGDYNESTIDWDDESDDHSEEIISGADLSNYWLQIINRLDQLDEGHPDGGYMYLPLSQNSNSVVDDVLDYAGLPDTVGGGRGNYWSPASQHQIFLKPDDYLGFPWNIVPPIFKGAEGIYANAPTGISPLVLDLDGDGIETTQLGFGINSSKVYFDLDGDSFAERTGWITGGDGLLAWDINNDGIINDNSEIFGNTSAYADGFLKLATLDSNSDNKITSADSDWGNLTVWIDSDGDGYTDAGELNSLTTLGITEINLNASALSNVYNNENLVSASSTFVINSLTRTISDVWFRTDGMDSHSLTPIDLIDEVFYLPALKGFGQIKDLSYAMSEDEDLLELVRTFTTSWSTARFDDDSSLDADIREILFRWGGVDTVSPTSRGIYADGQELAFLEKYFDTPYIEATSATNPSGVGQELTTHNTFRYLYNNLKASLIAQLVGTDLFEHPPIYFSNTGALTKGTLSIDAVAAMGIEADASLDPQAYWLAVTKFLVEMKNPLEFSIAEKNALDSAIQISLPSSSWDSMIASAAYIYQIPLTSSIFSDYLVGSDTGETITGLAGDDVLYGMGGNDSVQGGDGNDILVGGHGNDGLAGGTGNDIYFFDSYFGNDQISDTSGNDTIQFSANILPSQLRFFVLYDDLMIYTPTGQIQLSMQFYDITNGTNIYGEIETVTFADGSTINLSSPLTYTGTSANEVVNGTAGADILVGLGGNDSLVGKNGDDTYLFQGSFGRDTITESGGVDTIKFDSSVTTETITLATYATYDANITFSTSTDYVRISYQQGMGSSYQVEFLEFSDGFKANMLTYLTWTWGSSSAETINGTSSEDTILGRGGNDTISGLAGDDALHGGSGNDTLYGGDGNDQLNGGIGSDTLYGDNNDDLLYGDDGLDTMTGGAGADTFIFRSDTAFNNIDIVTDFSLLENDKINISDMIQGYDPLTSLITDFIQIVTSGSDSHLAVDYNGGGNSFVQIATLSNVTGLTDEQALVTSGNIIMS